MYNSSCVYSYKRANTVWSWWLLYSEYMVMMRSEIYNCGGLAGIGSCMTIIELISHHTTLLSWNTPFVWASLLLGWPTPVTRISHKVVPTLLTVLHQVACQTLPKARTESAMMMELPKPLKVGFSIAHAWYVDWHWAARIITEERGCIGVTTCTWTIILEEHISNSAGQFLSTFRAWVGQQLLVQVVFPLWVIFGREENNVALQDGSFKTAAHLFGFLDPSLFSSLWTSLVDLGGMLMSLVDLELFEAIVINTTFTEYPTVTVLNTSGATSRWNERGGQMRACARKQSSMHQYLACARGPASPLEFSITNWQAPAWWQVNIIVWC